MTAHANPLGFLHLRDEMAGLIARLTAPNNGEERAAYLSSWNGDSPVNVSRIGRGSTYVEAVCQSLLGSIQPGRLEGLIAGAVGGGGGDDGMVQRFQLLVQPDLPTEFEVVDEWPDHKAKAEAFALVRALVEMDPAATGAQRDTGFDGEPEGLPYLRFTEEAQEIYYQWLESLERRVRSGDLAPTVESHLAKYRSLVPSLALIFHLASGDPGGTRAVGSGPVPARALNDAVAMAEYLESHALRVYGGARSPGEIAARQLGRRVLEGEAGDRFTVRDIYRKGWSGLTTKAAVQAAVDVLADHGWVERVTTESGQRTFVQYLVNPRVVGAATAELLPPHSAL